jgi:nucleoside-diphosphate-sugar epimerase
LFVCLYGLNSGEKSRPSIPVKLVARAALEAAKELEWTIFRNGFFMNYYGMPTVQSFLQLRTSIVLDMESDCAAIPGDGNTPVTFTHTADVGKLVAASLDLAQRQHVSNVVGDKVSRNKFVNIAEKAKGD